MRKIFICNNIYDSEKRDFFNGFVVVDNDIISLVEHKPFIERDNLVGEVYELNNNYLIPGFVDAHAHLLQTEVRNSRIDLQSLKSRKEIIEKLRNTKERIIFAENFDESKIDMNRFLTLDELDEVSNEKPVIVRRICGHIAFVNSVARDILLKYDSNIGVDGILREEQVFNLDSIFKEDDSVLESSLHTAVNRAHSHGITAIGEFADPQYFKIYEKLSNSGDLHLRVAIFLRYKYYDDLNRAKIVGGFGNEFLKINGIKYFMDGSIGGFTAGMSFKYKNMKTKGMILIDNLKELIKLPIENNFQIATHAIGDRAINEVINAYESYAGKDNSLLRIEHAEIITDDIIDRISKNNLFLVMQPNFVRNWDFGENHMYDERLGEYAKFNNRYGDIVKRGIKLAFSSDSMPMSPLYGIKDIDSFERENQRLSFKDAIYYYTKGGAEAIRRGDIGEIKVGKKADFTVLDESLTHVKMTFVNGERVFNEEH